jgi:hypothetical protein
MTVTFVRSLKLLAIACYMVRLGLYLAVHAMKEEQIYNATHS